MPRFWGATLIILLLSACSGDKGDTGPQGPPGPGPEAGTPMPDAGADAALPSCAQMRWPAMLAEPIVPPRRFAGIDLAGDDTWRGLTIEEAQQTNCPATAIDATNAAWGSLNDVEVQFD